MSESNQGHWIGEQADPYHYFGFIYLIEDLTSGKKYVGKKQYWLAKRVKGCKSRSTTDKRSEGWKQKCWKESEWRIYKGSSPSLKTWMKEYPDNEYRYTILCQCYSKSELHYKEVEEMVLRGVLWRLDEKGEHLYFNNTIPATKFRVRGRDIFYDGDQ